MWGSAVSPIIIDIQVLKSKSLNAEAAAAGANALICTEKDVFNLPTSVAPTLPIYACRIRLALNDENAFWTAVRAAVGRSQPVTQA